MTNNDRGDAVTVEVIDVVAVESDWPWTGWSTPLWAALLVVLGLVVVLTAAVTVLIRRRRRKAG